MKFLKILKWVLIGFFSSTVLVVLAYRWLPVEVTPLMVIRCAQQMQRGESPRLLHRWVPLDSMSVYMPVAVMASEDQSVSRRQRMYFFGRVLLGYVKDLKFILRY